MTKLADLVLKVRSKNAGPFWLTVDIFCGTAPAFEKVSGLISTQRIAEVFRQNETDIKRFDIPALNVIKFSLPRKVVQGSRFDRDMHGAQAAVLVAELEL